ncbi:MAG: mevalonate kinase [Saprospiraceae bacterium]
MPLADFFGTWKYEPNIMAAKALQQQLPSFKQYLERQGLTEWIDTNAFALNLAKGLYFEANIPTGYGVGSSGALCAAILDKFGKKNSTLSLVALKKIFAEMESFFHGASSGTDPLVSYLNYPILLGEEIRQVELFQQEKTDTVGLFLLDTGIKREASPFINGFLERCKEEWYDKKCQTQLVPLVDDAIHTFLHDQWDLLFNTIHELSLFQFRYFDFMILDDFKKIWLDGLSSNHFKLKICGAGGGGFLLGISKDKEKTKKTLNEQSLIWI